MNDKEMKLINLNNNIIIIIYMDIQKAFNKHFIEFIDDVASYFHDRIEIQTTANALRAIRKANPKLIITVWKSSVVDKYIDEIEKGDRSNL